MFNNLLNMIGKFGVIKSGFVFGILVKVLYDVVKYFKKDNS